MAYVQRVGGSLALVMTLLVGAAMGQSPASGTAVLTSDVIAAQGAGEVDSGIKAGRRLAFEPIRCDSWQPTACGQ